jgi:hypothetical protein
MATADKVTPHLLAPDNIPTTITFADASQGLVVQAQATYPEAMGYRPPFGALTEHASHNNAAT